LKTLEIACVTEDMLGDRNWASPGRWIVKVDLVAVEGHETGARHLQDAGPRSSV